MDIHIEKISPAKAREYLSQNKNNRNIRQQHVKNLARDIVSGNWHQNGDSIRFNCDGELLDGQHRLSAIVMADRAVDCIVVRGLDKESRRTMDAGAKRTAGDQFGMAGIGNAHVVTASCRYAMSARDSSTMRPQSYTNSELFDFYDAHPGISSDINIITKRSPSGCGSIVAASLYAVSFSRHDMLRQELFDAWVYGEGGRNHPCVVARERLIREAMKDSNGITPQKRLRLVANSMVAAANGSEWSLARIPETVVIPGWTKR